MQALAYIHTLEGSDTLVYNLKDSPKIAEKSDLLYAGYTLQTGSQGTTLIFVDESLLHIEAYTRLTLTGDAQSLQGIQVEK